MRTVFITGANGWIGSYLSRVFLARGWKVVALVRRRGAVPGVEYRAYRLEDGKAPLEGASSDSVLIHCAFAKFSRKNRESDTINFSATRALLEQVRERGMKFVFFSSMSAHEQAESHYGRHKLELEKILDLSRDLVLRPGLVLGEGGLAGDILRSIRRMKVVPIFSGGMQPVQTVAIVDLGELVYRFVESGDRGLKIVAEEKALPIRDFYLGIAESSGVRVRLFNLPYSLFFGLLSAIELAGLELPVTTENLLGLKQLRSFPVDPAVSKAIRPFQETLKLLAQPAAKKKLGVLGRIVAKLRPSSSELRRLALCETDPNLYSRFKPIERGPVFAILMLGLIGIAALVLTPLRLFRWERGDE